VPATLEALARSKFRACFKLKGKDLDYARSKGRETLREHARDFVRARLAPAEPSKDGRQTPFRGHPVFVAQHATATCYRSCLAKWHKIPKNRSLSDSEQDKIVSLILDWVETQINK